MPETGTVAFWDADEGWGAVQNEQREGVGFCHFSMIEGVEGFRELIPGEPVEFEYEDDLEQDGCQYRVGHVRPTSR